MILFYQDIEPTKFAGVISPTGKPEHHRPFHVSVAHREPALFIRAFFPGARLDGVAPALESDQRHLALNVAKFSKAEAMEQHQYSVAAW
jgi:hypothetical protein